MLKRIAIVAALFFVLVAAVAILVPSSPSGVECGSLVSPHWTDDETDQMISQASDLYDKSAGASSIYGDLSDQAGSLAANARSSNDACDDARSTRKIVAGSAGGLAVIAPLALFFIGGARRKQHEPA